MVYCGVGYDVEGSMIGYGAFCKHYKDLCLILVRQVAI